MDRKSYGQALLNIIVRSNDALVVSLDAKWGEGKTTFVKMWQGLLSESNIPNIYNDVDALLVQLESFFKLLKFYVKVGLF